MPAGTRPSVRCTGDTWKVTPAQTVVDNGVISALGLMVTITVKGFASPHCEVLGITVYVAVSAATEV